MSLTITPNKSPRKKTVPIFSHNKHTIKTPTYDMQIKTIHSNYNINH